ncbi:hypothetical protein AXF42_Ash013130 [Apostasia shenzhenica]|uniref:DUF1677 domain-containing protein n=1 Tax=Apostasia shenzhenica TaxID=1088818 RepID=A0A2I0BD58_9ASPA|nr:hypothetical protein AXF42_Ash013130 [Apostasia shenzhenica]
MAISAPAAQLEVEFVKCECCGLTEECTPDYIAQVRDRSHGRWICGLCSDAVEDEIRRAGCLISIEEAIDRHMIFSREGRDFRHWVDSQQWEDSAEPLISAMRQLLRRSLDSPRQLRSTPVSPRRLAEEKHSGSISSSSLTRSGSCLYTVAG